jgi:hypothetical protein
MPESALAKKMKLKSNLKAAVINAPENYVDTLKHNTALSPTLNGKFDWIQIFVRDKAELDALAPKATKALKPESMLWISFPKGTPVQLITGIKAGRLAYWIEMDHARFGR